MTRPGSLAEQKRTATRERIAAAAAQLVMDVGLASATIDRIADAADVGRATFFRYFASKEDAVAESTTARWFARITTALAAQPAELSAIDAVLGTFQELAGGFNDMAEQIRDLTALTRSSAALNAWTLSAHLNYEKAIAELIAPRLPDLKPQDPRPRLIGALAMASLRISIDDWLVHGGDLPERLQSTIRAIRVETGEVRTGLHPTASRHAIPPP